MSVIHLDLNKFQIIPIADSARRLKISDDEYFSPSYGEYISNYNTVANVITITNNRKVVIFNYLNILQNLQQLH